jgi:hypothetical protein
MNREEMKRNWGLEVIYRCPCGDVPSHFMDGKVPHCPVCREIVNVLFGDNWEEIRKKYPRDEQSKTIE